MKRVSVAAVAIAFGVAGFLAGCGSDGIVFNGVRQVEQFPVRKTPIVHYNLPSELIDPVTGDASVDVTSFTSINLAYTDFQELASPGHDLWLVSMYPGLPGFAGWGSKTDSPVPGPPDWEYSTTIDKFPGPAWPDPSVTSTGIPSHEYVAAWTISLQNQWFLRDVNGSALVSAVPGNPPVMYESLSFSSHRISLIEGSNGATDISQLPVGAQREAIPAAPAGTGANGIEQIIVPASNVEDMAYNGQGAPSGLLAVAWRESPAKNVHIEDNLAGLQNVPVPDYFGGGGPISCGGGVFHTRFSANWQQTTAGTGSTISIDDGVTYSYYIAVVANHLIGYGVGLIDSAFALPGVINNQEDIMNISVVFDLTAFIAAGKEFNFVGEDHLRMQDTVNGDFTTPGILSTLPGTYRAP